MKENFDKSFQITLGFEGVDLENVPGDAGGLTKYGISKNAHPDIDIANLTLDQAKEIYRKDYWHNCECDGMPWPMDLVVFDTAVNIGCGQAMKWLKITQNWKDYLFLRMKFYADISDHGQNAKFFKGWVYRIYKLFKYANGWM